MSYPPGGPGWQGQQGPQGQQGQQGQWNAPPQYPQQQYPQQQYPPQQQWGPPQPPPPKSRTGLYVGLAAVVVLVLAAVGVTGFVTPGFFLSDDEPQAAAPPASKPASPKPSSPQTTTPSTAGADQVATGFVAKLNAKDAAGASAMVCKGSEDLAKEGITRATTGDPDLKADKVTTKTGISSDLSGTLNGKKAVGFVALSEVSKKWCVSNVYVFSG